MSATSVKENRLPITPITETVYMYSKNQTRDKPKTKKNHN
jgi:hypothetical protein